MHQPTLIYIYHQNVHDEVTAYRVEHNSMDASQIEQL